MSKQLLFQARVEFQELANLHNTKRRVIRSRSVKETLKAPNIFFIFMHHNILLGGFNSKLAQPGLNLRNIYHQRQATLACF